MNTTSRRTVVATLTVVICGLVVLGGRALTGWQRDAGAWLPANPGAVWIYRVEHRNWRDGGELVGRFIVAGAGAAPTEPGESRAWRHRDPNGRQFRFAERGDGIYRSLELPLGQGAAAGASADSGPTLWLPDDPAAGTPRAAWERSTQTRLVPIVACQLCEHAGNIAAPVTLRFAAERNPPDLPPAVRRYPDVLRAAGRGETWAHAGTAAGRRRIKVSQTEYYARGIGLVYQERLERIDVTTDDYYGHAVLTLIDYQGSLRCRIGRRVGWSCRD